MSTQRHHYLVVYGTLAKHHKTPMHILINESTIFIGPCEVRGRLYNLGRYPGFKHGEGTVHGELYKIINPNLLPHLDAYEARDDEDGSDISYKRVLVKLVQPEVSAWIYRYEGPVEEKDYIRSGSWQDYQEFIKNRQRP